MKEKIRILHVITTLDVGGAENMLLKLISHKVIPPFNTELSI